MTAFRALRRNLYFVWHKMVARCTHAHDPAFARYGGRGIVVDAAWRSFDAFYRDMSESYAPGLTLERKDNDGPYSRDNCRWATRREQQANTRKTVLIEHEGLKLPAREWGRRTGIDYRTILRRLERGMTVAEAMTPPPPRRTPCGRTFPPSTYRTRAQQRREAGAMVLAQLDRADAATAVKHAKTGLVKPAADCVIRQEHGWTMGRRGEP